MPPVVSLNLGDRRNVTGTKGGDFGGHQGQNQSQNQQSAAKAGPRETHVDSLRFARYSGRVTKFTAKLRTE
ncbi:hypothetical protein RRF57_012281 [Xylaria bambusicola]|uniref:Uncharacterized protein n=1 Tax=Xylaria bambusicola TaxID=326684 RepID=A0AAN7UW83_9PEZI